MPATVIPLDALSTSFCKALAFVSVGLLKKTVAAEFTCETALMTDVRAVGVTMVVGVAPLA